MALKVAELGPGRAGAGDLEDTIAFAAGYVCGALSSCKRDRGRVKLEVRSKEFVELLELYLKVCSPWRLEVKTNGRRLEISLPCEVLSLGRRWGVGLAARGFSLVHPEFKRGFAQGALDIKIASA